MRLGSLVLTTLVAATLSACGSDEPAVDTTPSPSASAASAEAEPVAPRPRDLVSSLPRTKKLLHGRTVDIFCTPKGEDSCGSMDPLVKSATVQHTGDGHISVIVSWKSDDSVDPAFCKKRKVNRPYEELEGGSYSPGAIGTQRRTAAEIGAWTGWRCDRSVIVLHEAHSTGDSGESVESASYQLTNEFGQRLWVTAPTDLAEPVVTEYVERLAALTES